MIRVLIVEDSVVVRESLIHILTSDPQITVIGTAADGVAAIEAVRNKRPDIITMDINLPKMNGFDATRRIMEECATPIVIVSGVWDPKDRETTFRAIEAGALAVVPRPHGFSHPEHEATARELINTVKLMSEVKVVRRWPRSGVEKAAPAVAPLEVPRLPNEIQVVAIGASTGGPPVLRTILSRLDRDFSIPVLIVQHIASGFVESFADWLAEAAGMPVEVARDGEPLLRRHAYVAPDGYHMGVGPRKRIMLSQAPPEHGLRPSVSFLFRSVADVFGPQSVGILLTGMGRDGAEELKLMKDRGAFTLVQDQESSVVHGMPGTAILLDAATRVCSPEQIAAVLIDLVAKR